ncbi:hypothetical protein M426DRAFT_324748 [Hypoxylon sp. CI-4A]|nr:hypothetical protein M426DRAFT_324748 [Hypoxylon sp. CI-4A]
MGSKVRDQQQYRSTRYAKRLATDKGGQVWTCSRWDSREQIRDIFTSRLAADLQQKSGRGGDFRLQRPRQPAGGEPSSSSVHWRHSARRAWVVCLASATSATKAACWPPKKSISRLREEPKVSFGRLLIGTKVQSEQQMSAISSWYTFTARMSCALQASPSFYSLVERPFLLL